MANIAIITARGGSKRIPGKNIKNFLGKPIIAYSINVAILSDLFDEIMVSTDSEDIAEISREYGANVPFMRSTENSSDFATTADVLIEVLEQYKKGGKKFDNACCIYPTAPFITKDLLMRAYSQLEKEGLDLVFPIVKFSSPIQRAIRLTNNKIELFSQEHLYSRTQDLENAYHDAGQFYFFKVSNFLKSDTLWTKNTGSIVIRELEAQDIDNELDWVLAELKYRGLKK